MAVKTKIKCRTCKGTGKVELSEPLREALDAVRRLKQVTPPMVWHAIREFPQRFGVTAINNRLEELHSLGLVKRVKKGRAWIYSVCAGNK